MHPELDSHQREILWTWLAISCAGFENGRALIREALEQEYVSRVKDEVSRGVRLSSLEGAFYNIISRAADSVVQQTLKSEAAQTYTKSRIRDLAAEVFWDADNRGVNFDDKFWSDVKNLDSGFNRAAEKLIECKKSLPGLIRPVVASRF